MTTELIKVNPEKDAEIVRFYNEGLRLRKYAEARELLAAADLTSATEDLSIIANVKKAMEAKRKDYLKPFQDHVKETNDAFRSLMEPVEIADAVTRGKILAFKAELVRRINEAKEINRLRMEAAQKEAALHDGEITESVNLVEVTPEAPRKTATGMGTASAFKVRKWEVTDFKLVPDEYKIIDASKVTRVVKAGIGSIEGIRIWEEDSLRVTPAKSDTRVQGNLPSPKDDLPF